MHAHGRRQAVLSYEGLRCRAMSYWGPFCGPSRQHLAKTIRFPCNSLSARDTGLIMSLKKGVDIRPAKGKLGILMPGMGAVATTFIAGVMNVRRGLAKPIGSLTQMGTIRLGKRTDN